MCLPNELLVGTTTTPLRDQLLTEADTQLSVKELGECEKKVQTLRSHESDAGDTSLALRRLSSLNSGDIALAPHQLSLV